MPHPEPRVTGAGKAARGWAISGAACLILLLLPLLCAPLVAGADPAAQQLPGSTQIIEAAWREALKDAGGDHVGENPEYVNRLALSGSAYLKQHADNPIDWHPWSENAFQQAREKDQLIFLSIGYASCHWCHVMERESFADPTVAAALNQGFVSIKVDRELQPDVDAYYQRVVQMVRGESGWPVSVFLTPDLKPVFAANYLDQASLLTAARRYAALWASQPALIQANAEMLSTELAQRSQRQQSGDVAFDPSWVAEAARQLMGSLDPELGGFGSGNKFPSEIQLSYLLNHYRLTADVELAETLKIQLDRLMTSGLVDVVFGGIFRYTTDRAMSRPHFEKMLYNQALTTMLYANAARWLGEPRYQAFAEQIIAFSNQYLRLPDGTFAAAIDAEHRGVEGGYYLWSDSQIQQLSPGLERLPFSEGKSYLFGSGDSAIARAQLAELAARREEPPRRVDNSITAWNALWLKALLSAGRSDAAGALGNTLWSQRWDGQQLIRFAQQAGYLDDYSYLSSAFWALYKNSGEGLWKARAKILDQALLKRFYQSGTLHYTDISAPAPLRVDVFLDGELPAPSAMALTALRRHPADGLFVDAAMALGNRAAESISLGLTAHLSVLQSAGMDLPDSSRLIAEGNGLIRLQPGSLKNQWKLDIQLDPGWHINAAEIADKQLIPTKISVPNVPLKINYPAGVPLETEFSSEPLLVYDGELSLQLNAPKDTHIGAFNVSLQACSERICLLPERFRLTTHQ